MSRPVVIGYDGGPSGADALTFGLRHAEWAGVVPIVAVVYPSPAPIGPGRVDAEWVAERRAEASTCLDRARELVGPDHPTVEYRAVASSSAAHGLSDLGESEQAGLVVVGSAGSGSAADAGPAGASGTGSRVVAGSTASRLLHGASAPVAVAPLGMRDRERRDPPTVGVAYVATPEAESALYTAAAFAAAAGAVLRVHTVAAGQAPVMPWLIGVDADQAFSATAREVFGRAADQALARLPSDLDATSVVLVGDVVDTLAALDVDVLFCGSRGYGPLRSVLLGGVSSRLMRRSRSPLVVVPRGWGAAAFG